MAEGIQEALRRVTSEMGRDGLSAEGRMFSEVFSLGLGMVLPLLRLSIISIPGGTCLEQVERNYPEAVGTEPLARYRLAALTAWSQR